MGELADIKKLAVQRVEELEKQSIEMASHLFDHPELSTKEFKSMEYLGQALKDNGFSVEQGIGGFDTAFKAEFPCAQPGPTVAFIAEYDALPDMGHACHHHIIASASVQTAIALSKLKDKLRGRIVCVGTPGEELTDAKGLMIANGVFDDIDVGLMVHGGSRNNNKLIVLAVDGLEFSYKGKPAHAAAAPHEGVNALDAVIMLFNSINALRQQLKEEARIHGNITRGGDFVTIIPETAVARFYIRAKKRKYLDEVVEKVKLCAQGAELQTGAKLTINVFEDPGNDLLKNTTLTEEFEENIASIGVTLDDDPFLLGSSDIGNLSYRIPVIHPMVQTADKGAALHTTEFQGYGKTDLAFRGMMNGMKSMAMTAVRVFLDDEFTKKIKGEHEKNLKEE